MKQKSSTQTPHNLALEGRAPMPKAPSDSKIERGTHPNLANTGSPERHVIRGIRAGVKTAFSILLFWHTAGCFYAEWQH